MDISTRAKTLAQLGEVTERLASNRLQLGDLESRAHRIRVESWMASDAEYISARDRAADFNAVDLTCDILTLKGEIAADVDLVRFYEDVLTWGMD